jgi:hypothetical protein
MVGMAGRYGAAVTEDVQDLHVSDAPKLESVDPLLVFLVHLANQAPDTVMSITLTMPGSVVSGDLICNQTWLEEVGAKVANAGGRGANGLADVLTTWHSTVGRVLVEGEGSIGNRLPGMIHMRDALVFTSNTSSGASHWRGRIDQVAGWSIGR